ncbi:DUF4432 family protein [Paracoccus sp. Z330]|uniref:DUF4432 family protein n=1 Tax=Paracoccus onchidii TaxID=3017813 RepID=A0ABT4ZG63_9RHOB|nr:DUF4432 family protein [Paracoccus onchidii]MDB6178249.1 DUF4432 family protein [Paracoccus onchidii]
MISDWAEQVANLRQLAAVRRITLEDGAERGVSALSFDTGGGLAFWVLADRSLDIGPLGFRGTPLAWHHPAGFIAPGLHDAQADRGTGIQRSLSGFLVTCGLDNARQPRAGLPLHGSLPLTPARVLACGEDWERPDPVLYVEGEICSAHLQGACLSMRRRIEAPIGGASMTLTDRVQNVGPDPAEIRILYHTNFGYPMVTPRTRIELGGRDIEVHDRSATCHATPGGFDAEITRSGCADWPGVRVRMQGDLPFVQLWRDARPRRNILAVEPSNCGREPDGTSAPGQRLISGETWQAQQKFTFSSVKQED